VLATNIDHVVICVSLAVEFDLGRIERFLALAMSSSNGEALLHKSALSWERGATVQRGVAVCKAEPRGAGVGEDAHCEGPGGE